MAKHTFNKVNQFHLNIIVADIINYYKNTPEGIRQLTFFPDFIGAGIITLDQNFPFYNIGIRGIEILKIVNLNSLYITNKPLYNVNLYVDLSFLQDNLFTYSCFNHYNIICSSDDFKNYNKNIYMHNYIKFDEGLNLKGHTFKIFSEEDLKKHHYHERDKETYLDLWGLKKILNANAKIDIQDIIDSNVIDFFYGYVERNQKIDDLVDYLDKAIHLHLNNNNYAFEIKMHICKMPIDKNFNNISESDLIDMIFTEVYNTLNKCLTEKEIELMKLNTKLSVYVNENNLPNIDNVSINSVYTATGLHKFFSCCNSKFFK